MLIKLYQAYSKPHNGLHTPPAAIKPREVEGSWKYGTDLLRPSISFDSFNFKNPVQYSYAYIGWFSRYYFIENWVYNDGFWTAILRVDVLASFRTGIINSFQYVLRSGALYDHTILDSKWPLKMDPGHVVSKPTFQPFAYEIASGMYVMGVVGGSGGGAIKYYAMGSTAFKLASAEIFNIEHYYTGITADEVSETLYKSIVDPAKYIQSVRWYPVQGVPADASAAEFIQIGFWRWPVTNGPTFDSQIWVINTPFMQNTTEVQMGATTHPDYDTLGIASNLEPYTMRTLDFPPFGRIVLDSPSLAIPNLLRLVVDFDLFTGTGRLSVRHVDATQTETLITTVQSQFGVDQPIRSSTYDLSSKGFSAGAKVAVLDRGLSFMGNALSAGFLTDAGEIAPVSSDISNTLLANVASPILASSIRSEIHGEMSSIMSYRAEVRLDVWHYRPVEAGTQFAGRPLCRTMRIGDIQEGYILCMNAISQVPGALDEENVMIANFLNSGIIKDFQQGDKPNGGA